MIDSLMEELQLSEDRLMMEESVDAFAEILFLQQGIIDELIMENEASYLCEKPGVVGEEDKQMLLNPYLPAEGSFQTDKQVAKGFSNFLQFHNEKKLSTLTAYDYCSRVKNLWEPFIKDWKEGNLQGIVLLNQERIAENSPLLNVYNNVYLLRRYVEFKIGSNSKPDKAWANASAALNNFERFVYAVAHCK